MDASLELYSVALELAKEAKDDERAMRAHGNLAMVHKLTGKLEPAVTHLKAAVQLAIDLKDVFLEGRCSLDLCTTLRQHGALDEALQAATRALDIAAELEDDEARGVCHTRIAALHVQRKQWQPALGGLVEAAKVWQGLAESMHE